MQRAYRSCRGNQEPHVTHPRLPPPPRRLPAPAPLPRHPWLIPAGAPPPRRRLARCTYVARPRRLAPVAAVGLLLLLSLFFLDLLLPATAIARRCSIHHANTIPCCHRCCCRSSHLTWSRRPCTSCLTCCCCCCLLRHLTLCCSLLLRLPLPTPRLPLRRLVNPPASRLLCGTALGLSYARSLRGALSPSDRLACDNRPQQDLSNSER